MGFTLGFRKSIIFSEKEKIYTLATFIVSIYLFLQPHLPVFSLSFVLKQKKQKFKAASNFGNNYGSKRYILKMVATSKAYL